MKKTLRILSMAAFLTLGVTACTTTGISSNSNGGGNSNNNGSSNSQPTVDASSLKVGMVCIGDPATSTYDKNFKDALENAKATYNFKTYYATAKGESEDAQNAAKDLAETCDIVILDSYGHQYWADAVADQYPNVKFVACTGDLAAVQKKNNLFNAFANIYEGRYLAGIAAGEYLNSIGNKASDHVLGYVAAWPYSEVISGYTAFYLGAKSVCADATMIYSVTSSWGDADKEFSAANKLISKGAKVVSQHADTYGAPNACNEKGVPNVSYNVSANEGKLASTYLCSSRIDWTPYFSYLVEAVVKGEKPAYDWSKGIAEGSVVVGDLGSCAAEGTKAKMDAAANKIKSGELHVFDTNTFTVTKANNPYAEMQTDANGHLTSFKADVIPDENYAGDTEVIHDGYFDESTFRSAPYFNCNIDGITCIDEAD